MIVAELLGEIITMSGENIVMIRHKSELYSVALVENDDNGNLVLVIHNTPDVAKEEGETINPNLDDNQSQDGEDTLGEESEDTDLEEILEELEGSTSPDIYSSRDQNSAIVKAQAAKYEINPQEAA